MWGLPRAESGIRSSVIVHSPSWWQLLPPSSGFFRGKTSKCWKRYGILVFWRGKKTSLGILLKIWLNFFEQPKPSDLRKLQHTPGTYPRPSTTCSWRKSFHICSLGYLGYVPGVCWNFLRSEQASKWLPFDFLSKPRCQSNGGRSMASMTFPKKCSNNNKKKTLDTVSLCSEWNIPIHNSTKNYTLQTKTVRVQSLSNIPNRNPCCNSFLGIVNFTPWFNTDLMGKYQAVKPYHSLELSGRVDQLLVLGMGWETSNLKNRESL